MDTVYIESELHNSPQKIQNLMASHHNMVCYICFKKLKNIKVKINVKAGKIKILMVSVERFKNERFRQFISSVAISQLVVDEAHCISEWGHNFRPDYLKLPAYKKELNIPQVLLLTATATAKVKRDMAAKFDIKPEHIVQTGFYRSNLNLSVFE